MMRFRPLRGPLAALVAVCAVLAGPPLGRAADVKVPAGVTLQQTEAGPVFADPQGLTLYTFDKDADGNSACNGNCAKAWPPLAAAADAKPVPGWTIVTREDGARQWAYKGKPLYTFAQWDVKPGDVRGNTVGGIWHVAQP
jgi:predicted lipoprotein with Yx(FWY)xxD motif